MNGELGVMMAWLFLGVVLALIALVKFDVHLHKIAKDGYLASLPKKLRRRILKNYVKNIWSWLAPLRTSIRTKTAISLLCLAGFLIVLASIFFGSHLYELYIELSRQITKEQKTPDDYRGITIRYLAIIAGAGAVIGYIIAIARNIISDNQNKVADEQNRINERGRITESIGQAITQIGAFNGEKPNIEVRLGGLYSLQRIMYDSQRDALSIVKILYAYVRENLKRDKDTRDKLKEYNKQNFSRPEEKPFPLPEDIVSALNIISQFNKDRKNKFGINAPEVQSDFTYADFTNYSIRDVDFSYISFSHADFSGSNLVSVIFSNAVLFSVNFSDTQLSVVNFSDTRFLYGKFCEVSLGSGNFSGADLSNLDLSGADLTNARNLTQEQVNQAFGDVNTRLPTGLILRDIWIEEEKRIYRIHPED